MYYKLFFCMNYLVVFFMKMYLCDNLCKIFKCAVVSCFLPAVHQY